MKSTTTDSLLDDARRVIQYATSAGMLQDGALSLEFESITAANAAGNDKQLTPLRIELNKKINEIAPYISLADLRAGRSPFDEVNQRIAKILQILLALLSVVLVLAVARYASELNAAGAMLSIFQEYRDGEPAAKLERLRILSERDAVRDVRSAEYQEYLKLKDQLYELVDKARGALSGAQEIASNPSARFWSRLTNDTQTASAQEAVRPQVASEAQTAVAIPDMQTPVASYISDAASDNRAAYDFASALNLELSGFTFSIISQLQSYIYIRSAWILPGLAGLLGSSVYLMRFFLFNRRQPVIEWYQFVVRIAMGGAAGVIVGWFIVASPPNLSGLVSTTSVPFGVAFVTGFSINILFSMLDRINQAISGGASETESRAR